jgi:hypothetical protein
MSTGLHSLPADVRMHGDAEDPPKRILAIAGGLGLTRCQPEGAYTIRATLGPQERVGGIIARTQSSGEVVKVRYEYHFDSASTMARTTSRAICDATSVGKALGPRALRRHTITNARSRVR